MGVFVLASAACGLAPSLGVLVAARVAHGVGAALITPTSLALIREAYDDARQRAKAVAYWALGGSVAAAAGPILGGVLTELDWRIIFFINLPVGALALTLLTRVPDVSPAPAPVRHRRPGDGDHRPGRVHLRRDRGRRPRLQRSGDHHGVRPGRARRPWRSCSPRHVVGTRWCHWTCSAPAPVAISLAAAFVTMAGFYGVVFVQSLYFQQVRAASPLKTGLLFLPMTAMVAILNPTAAKVAIDSVPGSRSSADRSSWSSACSDWRSPPSTRRCGP